MALLGGVGQVKSRFFLLGEGVNLGAKYVHGFLGVSDGTTW
jgi:hypothetical protein